MGGESCPVFQHPQAYLRHRRWTALFFPRAFGENAALRQCLRGVEGIGSVIDVPCGPGRLFPFWRACGLSVHGADLSEKMVVAAQKRLAGLGLDGSASRWDVFAGNGPFAGPADLAACVRFAYYFTRERRIGLLRILAGLSRRYVLVQYKTRETRRGRQTLRRSADKASADPEYSPKAYCTNAGIIEEVREAGLMPLRIAFISEFSDRVFVLAEKAGAGGAEQPDVIVGTTFLQWLRGPRRAKRSVDAG